tara:strand:- start:64 stop:300 length:237 start_codon:yes stop_codon:yes gene_type:complete
VLDNNLQEVYISKQGEPIMFETDKSKIKAIVVISEATNSVIIHFDGFQDTLEAHDFSDYMIEQLGIKPLQYTMNKTIH